MLLLTSQNTKTIADPKEFIKFCKLIEDRADERGAAALSLEGRGIGIALKNVAKKKHE
ncbi:MAG: hypothetical protein AAB481_02985 [Patescibacteria group bacterium]